MSEWQAESRQSSIPLPLWPKCYNGWPIQLFALGKKGPESGPGILHIKVLQEVQPQLHSICSQPTGFLNLLQGGLHCCGCDAATAHPIFNHTAGMPCLGRMVSVMESGQTAGERWHLAYAGILMTGRMGCELQLRLDRINRLHLVQMRVAWGLGEVWLIASSADTSAAAIAMLCLFSRSVWR